MQPDPRLIEQIATALRELDGGLDPAHVAALDVAADAPRLVVVGRRDAGKSTFVESMLGDTFTTEPSMGRSTEHTWVYRHIDRRPAWLVDDVAVLATEASAAEWFDEQSTRGHIIATASLTAIEDAIANTSSMGLQVHVYLDAPELSSWTLIDTPPDDEPESALGYRFIRPGTEDRIVHLGPAINHAAHSTAAALRLGILQGITPASDTEPLDLNIDFLITQIFDDAADNLAGIEQSAIRQWTRVLTDPVFAHVHGALTVVPLDQTYRDRISSELAQHNAPRRTTPLKQLLAERLAASRLGDALAARIQAFDAETRDLALDYVAASLRPSLTRVTRETRKIPKGYLKALERGCNGNQIEWATEKSASWVFDHLCNVTAHRAGGKLDEFLNTRRGDLVMALSESLDLAPAADLVEHLARDLKERTFNIPRKKLAGEVTQYLWIAKNLKVSTKGHPGPWANLLFGNSDWQKRTFASALAALPGSALDEPVNGACDGFLEITEDWSRAHDDLAGVAAARLSGGINPERVQALLSPLLAQLSKA